MERADLTNDAAPGGPSARGAWLIVAVLAAALVAFAYAVGARDSSGDDERTRHPDDVRVPRVSAGLRTIGGTKPPDDVQSDDSPVVRAPNVGLESTLAETETDQAKLEAELSTLRRELAASERDGAKLFCASLSTTAQEGLARYASAEDSVRKAIEDAKKASNRADEAACMEIYRALLQDSDAYTKRVVTPEFIESIPWKNLLADGSKWSKSMDVPGFSCRILNGTLTTSPPDTGGTRQAVIGVLDQTSDNLRHFALDMDFAVKGCATMYFHVAPPPGSPNETESHTYDLVTKYGYLEPDAKYHLVATYIGTDLDITLTGDTDYFPEYRPNSYGAERRKGGIAFVITAGTRLTITRMRIKELR